ncbi:MAG: DsbA family protein [Bdellovibrionales bacterium]
MQPLKLLLVGTLCLLPLVSQPAQAAALTDAQKKEVENIVRTLLTDKEPELIIKAAQAAQMRMEKESVAKGQKAVTKNLGKLTQDDNTPVSGNPKGDVTIVEFFDYSCGYCKMVQPHLEKLMNTDKNIRYVYKELPILGAGSMAASKAALASVKQGKYVEFHKALMESPGHLTESRVMDIAKKTGLDLAQLKKDMQDSQIEKTIKENVALARELGAQGTPTFIIGGKLRPGALDYEQFREAVEQARSAKK